jgi:hypothetical protein
MFISACGGGLKKDSTGEWKSEIIQTEKDFSAMAQKEGIRRLSLPAVMMWYCPEMTA